MKTSVFKSWRTAIPAIIGALGILANLIISIVNEGFVFADASEAVYTALLALGLIQARDHVVSSEAAGLKEEES